MKHIIAFLVLSISVILGSCTNPGNPASTSLTRYGRVQLEDSTGNPIPPPYSGITVTIPEANISVNADALGHWTIPNAPPYPYNYHVVVSKPGFGTISFPEDEGDLDSTYSYSWFPTGFVVLTTAPDSIVHVEKVFCSDSTEVLPAVTASSSRVFIFIDTLPNIPSTGVHLSDPSEIYGSLGNDWVANDPTYIGNLNLHHGQTIYITACAASNTIRYLDSNNHEVLANVGPSSNAYPIVIP